MLALETMHIALPQLRGKFWSWLLLFGHGRTFFDRFDRRMGSDTRVDANAAAAQRLLHARHDVTGAQIRFYEILLPGT